MGEHDRCSQPSGLLPNGLLPNASDKVVCGLDVERWSRAEEATARLIACIQPNQLSEERRNAVADYVQRLIMKCFPCQVFTFGSVPLKTYLPDGDIDLTAFCKNQNVKDTWATKVRDILESEEKNEDAEFHVKEVQYIQAEVKIIKCLVENIVVDISFNQLGGLCTLCFLEEVDLLINQNHLFKRSIILIKAWCYYESRILGAHHGLISTYALETLVLYIFHVFNNSFAGPLEILYRFLEFFSKFDWEIFCVSLWGPVPISSLPDVTAEPPRKDSRELLFSKLFLDACSTVYAVFPGGQESQGQTFISKHFNVIDPLRVNNNLGRSVNKGNFFRIRSAFAFGAKRLARLLDCPKADIASELNQFFLNTWERHGSGHRPDAPFGDLRHLSLSIPDHKHGLDNQISTSSSKKTNENTTGHDTEVVDSHTSCSHFSYRVNHPMESSSKRSDVCAAFDLQNQKSSGGLSNSRGSDDKEKCNQKAQVDKGQRSKMLDQMMDEAQGKNLVARTMSSPELYKYNNGASRVKFDKAADSGKCQLASTEMDDSRKMYLASEIAPKQKSIPSIDDSYTARSISSHQIHDLIADIDSAPDCCIDNSGVGSINVELTSSMGAQGLHQEEQDHVNMMAASMHRFGGQILMPLNLASAHVPLPLSSSMLASIGYAQRNLGGMFPPNIPFVSYGQFHQQGNETLVLPLMADAPHFGDKGDTSCGSFGPDDGTCQSLHTEDRKLSISTSLGPVSYRVDESNSSVRVQHKLTKENLVSMREAPLDFYQHQGNIMDLNYPDDRILSSKLTASNASSQSKASSESSWNGSSGKETNTTREKLGRKTAISAAQYATSGKGKSVSYHTSVEADYENQDWIMASTLGTEMAKRSMMTQGSLHVPRYYSSSLEIPQTSSSDSILPIPPMLLGPGSLHRVVDNGAVPIPFYATGPPVPFLTMVPVSYFPTETGASEASKSHLDEDIGLDGCGSGQTFDASVIRDEVEGFNVSSDMRSATATEQLEAHIPDILNSDILSHWQNLQYGRSCQSKRYPGPPICPSPVLVPPMYLHGSFPLDGPGSPLAANMNLFSQLMGYGPRVVPAAPLQSMSSQLDGAYQRHADELIELPRYRSGTGTYLPNPKAPLSERHVSGMRRNNYNHDRGDHHRGDKEGNWSTNSKLRAAGRSRSHNRGQAEKPRLDRSESRADRPWGSRRHESSHPQQSQNSPLQHSSSHNAPGNTAYGMYPAHPNALLPNGPAIPSVVMLYPYDRGPAYSLPTDRLEFGSLGPVGFIGVGNNESSQIDGNHMRGLFEEQRFHEASVQHSSPDQPSSPRLQSVHFTL